MTMKVSQNQIAASSIKISVPVSARAVKADADFVAIVSRYTRLRRSGRQLVGLCPFHSEAHPSFFVDPNKKIFYCHGCQAGGDLLEFIMRAENCDFSDAMHIASACQEAQPFVLRESFAEAVARIARSLPAPGIAPCCSACGSKKMEFRRYRNNRFGGAYACKCGNFFGDRQLRRSLLLIRGSACQWCSSSLPVDMFHARKHANQYDPAFIILLCVACRNNAKKVYALHAALGASDSDPRSGSRFGASEAREARPLTSPQASRTVCVPSLGAERRNDLIRAANDASSAESACEPQGLLSGPVIYTSANNFSKGEGE